MPTRTRSRSKSPARAAASTSSAASKRRSRSKSPSRKTAAAGARKKSRSASPSRSRSSSRSRKSAPAESQTSTPKSRTSHKANAERSVKTTSTPTTTQTSMRSVVSTSGTPGIRASARLADKVTTTQVTTVHTTRETVPLTVEREMPMFMVLLHVLLLPVFMIWANRICTKESCEIMRVAKIPQLLSNYFDMKSSLVYAGFLLIQLVLMLPPIRSLRVGRNKYHCNGMLSIIVTLGVFGLLAHFKYPVTFVPPFSSLKFLVLGLLVSFVLATAMYIKSAKAPAYTRAVGGNTGNMLYDFYMGREISPRNGRIDWKQYVFRVGLTTYLLLNVSALYKEVVMGKGEPNYVICYVTACQIFYILDAFWCENQMFVTATFRHNGLGLQLIAGLLVFVPYINSVSTRYAVIFRPERRWFQLVGSGFLYCVGYFMYRGALSQMNTFKQQPASAASYMSHIQGSGGKRILTGGWWSVVRRPNYLGDILMNIAITLPCGFTNFFPWICPLILLIHLCVRARAEDRACRKRYGPAWETYKSHTKYVLIPYVF